MGQSLLKSTQHCEAEAAAGAGRRPGPAACLHYRAGLPNHGAPCIDSGCREDVDAINAQELRALAGEARRFTAQDGGSGDVLAAACPARRTLDLKVGVRCGCGRGAVFLVSGAAAAAARYAGPAPSVSCGAAHHCAVLLSPFTTPRRRWARRSC